MKEIKKYNTKSAVDELLHGWVNELITKEIHKASYDFTPTKMYCNNSLVAIHYKKCIIIKEFNNKGFYGNGLNTYDVERAANYLNYYVVPNLNIFNGDNVTLENKINFIVKDLIYKYSNYIDRLSYFKEFASNNRLQNPIYALSDNISLYHIIPGFKTAYNKAIKRKVKSTISYNFYGGWGRGYDYRQRMTIEFKFEELFNGTFYTSRLTEEEKKIITLKKLRHNYCSYTEINYNRLTKYTHTLTNFIKEYEKRGEEFLKECEKYKQDRERIKEERELLKQKEEIIKNLQLIQVFRQSDLRNLRLLFQILKMKNGYVHTSMGVSITIEDAKNALYLFRNEVSPAKVTKTIGGFKYTGISNIQVPHLIKKDNKFDIEIKEEKALVIGCHKIPESEINALLEYYKLDW